MRIYPITGPPPETEREPDPGGEEAAENPTPRDLDACPRCSSPLEEIVWGLTNCPSCGLHFECC